jgi:glycosyltransferase involved in cell wall biosynthesis
MNILVICQYYHPEQFKINDICVELANQGHQVTVLTGLPNYPMGKVDSQYRWFKKRREQINGVHVIRSWLVGRGKGTAKLALNYVSFALSACVKSLKLKKDFDLIMVYQLSPVTMALPGILLKRLTRKPLILYCLDLWPESLASAGISSNSRLYRVMLRMSRWIYRQADEIYISSRMFEQYFRETLDLGNNITYLPGYAESMFENLEVSDRMDKETVDFVFAGNIGEMQSVETIIYAANELKDVTHLRVHIVGDGSSREKVERLTKQLRLKNVIFHGQFPITEMPRFYRFADAFLVTLKANPYISYTLPNKVQSYMAAGKPIIGAIDGETKIVIEEAECGHCAPAENFVELAQFMKKFAQEKDKHATYGKNARDYYNRHFSKGIFYDRLNRLLRNQMEKRHTSDVQR